MELPKSKYKNVYALNRRTQGRDNLKWLAKYRLKGKQRNKTFPLDQEKEAAKWIDIQLIRAGKDPVNILTKKIT